MEEKINYPLRINRYLALNNYCSRREADVLIEKGLVFINGKKAAIGDKVLKMDKVEVDLENKKKLKKYAYFAYYKPQGIVTHSPEKRQRSIQEITRLPKDIFPIGRLDRESHGLIILTNDGRITGKLLDPKNGHEREYEVETNKPLTNLFLASMQQGVKLEDCTTKPCIVEKINHNSFRIILTEGKKHQIRRMCAALGYNVEDLKRVRIMDVKLENLKPGQKRSLEGKELKVFLESLHL